MAITIKLKNASGSDPSASDLVVGEVAIRTDNGKLFTKKDDGSVAEISGSGGGGGSASFSINTLSSSSGTGGGSASFNGSAYRFTLSDAPATAAQLLVSIDGVIQKPNTGTSQPSEGFAIDGDDIIFAAAPANGASFFIVSTVLSASLVTPADNTVTSSKIADGAIVNADVNASAAIAGTKISPDFGSQNIQTTGNIQAVGASSSLKVGDTGNDNYVELSQETNTASVRGFTNQHSNASVLENLQGTTNQHIVLGDVDPNNSLTLFGISLSQSGSYSTRLTLSGTGNLNVHNNITLGGTVDGVDIAAFKTSFDNLVTDLISDTSPQLGGDLDVLARKITTSTSNGNVAVEPNGSGVFEVRGAGGNDGTLQLNCSAQSHGIKLKSPPHSAGQSYTLTFPSSIVNNGALLTDSNGDLSFSLIGTSNISNDAVTLAKIQNISTNHILGRVDSGTGDIGTLNATQIRTLINVENGATADQTAAEIRALVESASDSNVFTDADHTKLNGIESNATADQSNSEIKTAYEANSNTNAFTDALLTKLNGIATSATNVTNNNQLTNGAGYITSAALVGANNGGNAALLDGIDSTQFMRSDQDDTTSGTVNITSNSSYPLNINGNDNAKIVLQGSNAPYIRFRESSSDKAYIQWNDNGFLGIRNQEDNAEIRLKDDITFSPDAGSNNYKIWHANNDGSGSGLDADVLDGQQGSYYLDYNNLTNVPSVSSFPSGTKMFFQQSSAPTGWTKDTSNNNNSALRIVTGNVSSGGSNNFTTAFNSSRGTSGGSVSNHTLTEAQIPSHRHRVDTYNEWSTTYGSYTSQGGYRQAHRGGTRYPPWTQSIGSGNAHNHGFSNPSLNLNVKYVDVIMCTKN